MTVDLNKTLNALEKFDKYIYSLIKEEALWINKNNKSVLLLSDISPYASLLSNSIKSPLILLGNFGWDEIYEDYGLSFKKFYLSFRHLYSKANLLIKFPFSMPMKWDLPTCNVGLTFCQPNSLPLNYLTFIKSLKQKIV